MKRRAISLLLTLALAPGLVAPAWAQNKYMVAEMPDASLVLSVGQEAEAARRLNALGITDYDPAKPGSFTRGTAALWAWNALSALTADITGSKSLSCRTKDTSTGLILNVNEASPHVIIDCDDTVPAGEWMYAEVKSVKTYDPNLRVLLWENSNPEVATLSAATDFTTGRMAILDGLKPGTTTVTATLNNGTTVSRTITVTDALADPVINLPQFPCTVELRNASGVQLYRLTITEGRYDLDDGLWFYLKGTVDAASSSAANIMLNFPITDDATGEVVEQDILVLPGHYLYPLRTQPRRLRSLPQGPQLHHYLPVNEILRQKTGGGQCPPPVFPSYFFSPWLWPGCPASGRAASSFLISQWIRKVRAARSRMMAPTRAISLRSRTTTVRRISPPSLNSRAMARPWASLSRVSGSRLM